MKHERTKQDNQLIIGVWYAVVAFIMWGVLPIYWKALNHVPAMEILAHRILWSFIFVLILVLLTGGKSHLKEVLAYRSKWVPTMFASLLISMNWLLYIWAVNSNHLVEASLGYYINPLISILLGMIVLRERLNFWQLISLLIASIGVLITTFEFGQFPWIALCLALSFGLYGLVKKLTKFEANVGLLMETFFVTPIAFIYILYLQIKGLGAIGTAPIHTDLLFIGAGVVTALPLLWFAQATKRVPLSTVGFAQYIAPSISLLLGVLVYHESFTHSHLLTFGMIWFALILYSFSNSTLLIHLQPKYFKMRKYTR